MHILLMYVGALPRDPPVVQSLHFRNIERFHVLHMAVRTEQSVASGPSLPQPSCSSD
ncbi:hypothetical protein PMIN01_05330 [Paraphaeosphaeria minitans]|uniref:Uncharacterized protein n=1 Tax=Paraphaeosphaeria minitans TaxID=565426 RepID=A0A9P6GLQ7_9PLEO|nr:hypothetical protein PMIN01_05330 [Paraphaeosphaeria minitans]